MQSDGVGEVEQVLLERKQRLGIEGCCLCRRQCRLQGDRETLRPLGDPAFQGEHNRTVFGELGLSEDEIDNYFASGALVGAVVPANVPNVSSRASGVAKIGESPSPTTNS